ncbi:MAG: hypothetical protein OC190_07355 [Novosphingobium aromaticivorans]|nr:hypothetical protein [Novosphingobium aromaticivorans]
MILSAQRLRSIGWLALLAVCGAAVMVLSFRVNALRSQVHRAEGQIVALKQQKMYLETEFETRANQQQLKAWNDLEFGYVAPTAGQYLENERQLAALSKPADPGAPAPIRVASVDDTVIAPAAFPELAGPELSGSTQAKGLARAENGAVRKLAETHEAEPVSHGADARDADLGPGRPRALDHAQETATLAEKLGTIRPAAARKDQARKDQAHTSEKTAAKKAHPAPRDERGEKRAHSAPAHAATVEKAHPKPSRESARPTKGEKKEARSGGEHKSARKAGVKTNR